MDRRDSTPATEVDAAESAPGRSRIVWLLVAMAVVLFGLVLALLWSLGQGAEPEFSYERSGLEPVLVVTGPGEGDSPAFRRPLSAAWGPREQIYVADTGNARICVFDSEGSFVREFGRARTGMPADRLEETLLQPAGIAVAQDGTVYVADLRRDAVLVFDEAGEFIESIVTRRGWRPVDVAVNGEQLAVASPAGITVLSTNGEVISTIDGAQSGAPLSRPNGVEFLSEDEIVVADTNNARIVAFALDGTALWVSTGDVSGQATGLPRGISAGSDGSVVYADAFRFALVRVSEDGAPRGMYGERGADPAAFEFPNDVDMLGDRALVADKDNGRVQIVRLLGWPDADGLMEPGR